MTKYLRSAVLLLLVAALLPLVPAGTKALAQDKVTLRVTNWAGVDEAAEFQAIVDEINATATDFELVYEPKPDDYYVQLQTQLAGGTAPDLFWLDQNHMAWAYQDVLLDINSYLEADDRGAADPADYYPGVWQIVALNNGIYGLPWIAQPVVLYYNKDIFDEMGMDYPTAEWTWDQFQQAAIDLTNEEHYGFILNSWPPIHMFIWSMGGEVVSEDLQTSPIDTPEAIAGAQLYADMIYNPECCAPEEVIAEEGNAEMFKAGRVAMFMGGAADDLDRVEGLNVGVSPVPQDVNGGNTTFAWTAATVINADTENPDLAYEALVQLTEAIQNWKIVSPRISQTTIEHLVASEPRKEANAEAILAAVPDMRALRIIPRQDEWDTIFWEDFQDPLFHGEDSVENLAADARILLEDVLPIE
ncbi:MAG TPA: sugar ABC transporter substrate-binding protein [Aggregatilinea sp.]|uniref:ABC transporter substrate-binding protein n=1 Tax=Aggregatilinea sp. TaxID=2806333 RepID=UPI002C34FC97|nr:sugar ABC transporter substrate-binding protein [Aggregatilinea sp.]HML22373.1 sugar ABC transporter substrate-binding protein [Aggregatilinea sp.]